jgi:hypothetical protein
VAVGALFTIPKMPYAVPEVAFESPLMAGVPAVLVVSTSSDALGAVVPRPTLPAVWYNPESPSVVVDVHLAM